MKNRSGADSSKEATFGPAVPPATKWLLTRRASPESGEFERRFAYGPTAFEACKSLGWSLAELVYTPKVIE